MKMALGVERLDYTKGILDRFRALDEFFQQHSDWIGRVVFVQVAAPSRSELPPYGRLHKECLRLVAEINERYGRHGYRPIILIDEHRDQSQLVDLYRAADVCVVSSLHDGMNLVAKEFVAARDDEQGVLVLSTFAGASRELTEALLVNPFDTTGMGEVFFQALTMPADEVGERMRRLRETVRSTTSFAGRARCFSTPRVSASEFPLPRQGKTFRTNGYELHEWSSAIHPGSRRAGDRAVSRYRRHASGAPGPSRGCACR